MAKDSSMFASRLVSRLLVTLSRVVDALAAPAIRAIILLLFVGLLGYWWYGYVWLMLSARLDLPPGVAAANPALDEALLRDINTQRAARVDRVLQPYSASTLFIPATPKPR